MESTTLKQQALNDIRSGRLLPALQLLTQASESDTHDPEIWFYLGAVHGSLGDAANAELSFRQAIVLRPDFIQARLNLGNALKAQGRNADAALEYQAVIDHAPQHATAWIALAFVLAAQDRFKEAEQTAQRALELAPNAAEAYVALGSVHLAKKELAEAARLFSEALKRNPNSVTALVNLGFAHKSAGRLSEAKTFLQRALTLQPQLPEAHYSLGLIFLQEIRMDDAESALNRTLELNPRHADAFEQLGALLRHRDKRKEALELYQRFAKVYPEHQDVKFFLPMLESGKDPGRIPVELLAGRYRNAEVASSFDEGMTKQLDYALPVTVEKHMVRLLGDKAATMDALDLGCGTGLYGRVVKRWTRRLVGVDLAVEMLEEARRKGVYDELVCGELIETLDATDEQYDLVIAMDVLVFFGDLAQIFERVKKILRPQGLFIFDLEKADEAYRWQLHIAGNYLHARRYITELAESNGFTEALCEEVEIRNEGSLRIKGHLVFFQAG